jgi:hypothetical protein
VENNVLKLTTYNGRSLKWLLYIGLGLFIANVLLITFVLVDNSDLKVSHFLNLMTSVFLIIQFYYQAHQMRTNFIEFGEQSLIYQTSSTFSKNRIDILFNEISGIQIHLNEIEIKKNSNEVLKIPISTTDYSQRIAFKHQFEELKLRLGV